MRIVSFFILLSVIFKADVQRMDLLRSITHNNTLTLPWSDAEVIWHMDDLTDASGKYKALKTNGTGTVTGIKLSRTERNLSKLHGGDGKVAFFDGNGWFSFMPAYGDKQLPSSEAFTVYMRIKPEKSGGLIRTDLFSLVIHDSGLVIGILAIGDTIGTMYREIPFSLISFNEWHDVIVRYRSGFIDFILDGSFLNHIHIQQTLQIIDTCQILLGGWQIDDPPLEGFPGSVVAFLFQRLFTGSIDHTAIWNRALSDEEIADLSYASSLTNKGNLLTKDAQKCLDDYRNFFDASRAKDIPVCTQLGLSMRAFMARDPKRPVYHLTAPMDAILDPAGCFYHNGQYHVYSYRNMVSLLALTPLAHYISYDLVHWRDVPIGVWPDSELDVYGIWLTNLFYNNQGIPSMIYTALGKQGKIGVMASSHDDLVSFTDKRAVMTGMVHHDGHTWKDGDTWYALTTRQYWGERPGDLGDAIILLTSKDLVNWIELGEIFCARKHPDPVDNQQRWGFTEYPYLIEFNDKHVLIAGTRPARYWAGWFDKKVPVFIPDDAEGKLLDYLNPFHCFNPSVIDNRGPGGSARRIIQSMHLYASGSVESIPWYGVHLLPRVITLEGDRLVQQPVPEIEKLRGAHRHYESIIIFPDGDNFLPDIIGDALEIIAEFDPGTADRFGMRVRSSEEADSGTEIFYETSTGSFGAAGNLKIPSPYPELGRAPSCITNGQSVQMHIFIDHSVLEIFVNGQTCSGVFTDDTAGTGIDLFSEGGDATLVSLDVWEMKPAWPIIQ